MTTYGIIGFPLQHSFSPLFFQHKFEKEKLSNFNYQLLPLNDIAQLPSLFEKFPDLMGFNVTIPYKEKIIPFLDIIDPTAQAIGAVNVVKIVQNNSKKISIGYNSDCIGFEKALNIFMPESVENALILGTGGAAKAVAYVLQKKQISYRLVSRKDKYNCLTFNDLTKDIIQNHTLIINTTPQGMFPNIGECPPIPYHYLTEKHYLFDLIYNPSLTQFMIEGQRFNAHTCNGLKMLQEQAEESWRIWQSSFNKNNNNGL